MFTFQEHKYGIKQGLGEMGLVSRLRSGWSGNTSGRTNRIFSSPKRLSWLPSLANLSTVNWTETLPFLLYGFRQFPRLIVILLPQENSYFVGDNNAMGTFLFALFKNNIFGWKAGTQSFLNSFWSTPLTAIFETLWCHDPHSLNIEMYLLVSVVDVNQIYILSHT